MNQKSRRRLLGDVGTAVIGVYAVSATGCLGGDSDEGETAGKVRPEYITATDTGVEQSSPEGGTLAGAAIEVPDSEPEWAVSDGVGFELWYLAESHELETIEQDRQPDYTDPEYDFYVYNGAEYGIEIETDGNGEGLHESTPGGLWKYPSGESDGYELPEEYKIHVVGEDGSRVGTVTVEGEKAHGNEVWMHGDESEPTYLFGMW